MPRSHTMLLFDPTAQPSGWNERMHDGEYAVLYSFRPVAAGADSAHENPYCSVFGSLEEAEEHAFQQVDLHPALRCRIYDRNGLASQPVREIAGREHRGESELSAGFRRWAGLILCVGGAGLILFDWMSDFSRTWPATLGIRAFPVGLILLVTELVVVWTARRKSNLLHKPRS